MASINSFSQLVPRGDVVTVRKLIKKIATRNVRVDVIGLGTLFQTAVGNSLIKRVFPCCFHQTHSGRRATMNRFPVWLMLFLLSSSSCTEQSREEIDHRVTIRIDREVTIVPAGVSNRAMMSMARHPDRTIYLALQTASPSLYSSRDEGETWSASPAELGRPHQVIQGMGVSQGGRIFLIHQTRGNQPPNRPDGPEGSRLYGQDLFVSYSDDGGRAWTASRTDFTRFGAGTPNIMFHEDGNRAVIEKPDGTLLFNTTIVPSRKYMQEYPPADPVSPPNYQYGGAPGDYFGDVVFRSTDGGITWGQPSRVCTDLNAHESTLAIGPKDPNRILIMTRIQRLVRPEEDGAKMMMETGNPQPYYKQGALFESEDGGRTFRLAPGGMTEWYGHRGTVYWSPSDVVVVTHHWGGRGNTRKVARISLDGGRTWVDGTPSGTPRMNYSNKFLLAPVVGFTSPTIELSPGRFMTAAYHYEHIPEVPDRLKGIVGGIHWTLEKASGE